MSIFKTKNNKKGNKLYLKSILYYLMPIIAGNLTFAFLFTVLAIYTYSTGVINTFSVIIGWLCLGIGAFFTGLTAHKILGGKGFATGAIYGIMYSAVSLGILLFISKTDSAGIFIGIPISVVFSMIGGICDSINKH